MKKFIIGAFILIAIISASTSTIADVIDREKGFISVTKAASMDVLPNQAEITIGVETSDISLNKAAEKNALIASNINNTLKSLLREGDYIKTGDYSTKPIYSYTKDNKRIFDKYIVNNTVIVRTKQINLISKLIDTSIALGATNIDDIKFSATDYESACSDLTADLTKKTYSQAASIASSIKAKIVGIKNINASCTPENSRPFYGMMKSSMQDNSVSSPIEGGKIKIYANIDASYYVK